MLCNEISATIFYVILYLSAVPCRMEMLDLYLLLYVLDVRNLSDILHLLLDDK